MKAMYKNIFLFFALFALLLSSCIRDEAANAECDILAVDAMWLDEHRGVIIGAPVITNNSVSVMVKPGTDRSALNPSFVLTEGARLAVAGNVGQFVDGNGVTLDFNTPQTYMTLSADGKWSKEYVVSFTYPNMLKVLSFENYSLDGKYYRWYEIDENDSENPERYYWASGNAGYAFTGRGKVPEDFPTSVAQNGVNGSCVKLTTCDTGSFGKMAGMPIAAGNLFIGEFQSENAMRKPLEATRFGFQLVNNKPLMLTGYYKYSAGDVFTDKKKNEVPEKSDTCSIYSVLYEVEPDDFVPLDGSNVMSSERVVMVAQIENPGEPDDWTYFEAPYRLREGKVFDSERMNNSGYAITVVASSSKGGDFFEGAVGSTMYIDEFRIVWDGE